MSKRRVFPEAFKREAVERVGLSGLSAGAVAAELGLHETVLRRWVAKWGSEGAGRRRGPSTRAAPPSPSALGATNAGFGRGNDRLRMEREILKKTVTIFGAGAK